MGKIAGISAHISDKNPWTGELFRSATDILAFHTVAAYKEGVDKEPDVWLSKPWKGLIYTQRWEDHAWVYSVTDNQQVGIEKRYGRGFRDVGYHFIIERDGRVVTGRRLDDNNLIEGLEVGAHTLGHNSTLIGICFIAGIGKDGNADVTVPQINAFRELSRDLAVKYRFAFDAVWGHKDLIEDNTQGKTCPNISREQLQKLIA